MLVPRHWTIAPPVADEGLGAVGIFHDHNVESGATILLGTDGSGGPFSDDPRLRKSAWAVVALRMDGDEFVVIGTMSGALVDSDETCNTVPRAELMALVRALEALSWHDGPVQVAFHASYVQTTWQKVSHNKHVGNPNGDLK